MFREAAQFVEGSSSGSSGDLNKKRLNSKLICGKNTRVINNARDVQSISYLTMDV